jgi:hypothetical protein
VVVATLRRFNRSVVQPVVIAPAIGLVEGGISWVAQGGHATKRPDATNGGEADDPAV